MKNMSGVFALNQYNYFSDSKTLKYINISFGQIIYFANKEVKELLSTDELEIEKLGDKPTALFIITSDTDTTYNFWCTLHNYLILFVIGQIQFMVNYLFM